MFAAKTTDEVGNRVNGIDLDALGEVVREIERDPAKALVEFRVTSQWQGQTRSRAKVDSYTIGGRRIERAFAIDVDEPFELLGENTAPNPQEMLMTAFNACIMVGYVAVAATKGVKLERVEIETNGQLDLRGFLGIDDTVPPGYETIRYVVRIKGDGTADQLREIHEIVMKTSPNYFNIARPIKIEARLQIER
jgi:uncharacterized OsmC-like protein